MARYRHIHEKIWEDPDIRKLTPSEKLIFIYLCTNAATSESGVYAIMPKTISLQTGVKLNTVTRILTLNRIKNIAYDSANSVVYIRNFLKYNGSGDPRVIKSALMKDIKLVSTDLWFMFVEDYAPVIEKLVTDAKESKKPLESSTVTSTSTPITTYTPTSSDISNGQKTNDIPYESMVHVFAYHWKKRNLGEYLSDPDTEYPVAVELYENCRALNPDDPMEVFREWVERLMTEYDIKKFKGLKAYWNAGAERTPWAP